MDKFDLTTNKWLEQCLHELTMTPEFQFASGSFLERLEQTIYWNMGGTCYPVRPILKQIVRSYEESPQVKITTQDIKLRLVCSPVYKIEADCAIMAQDSQHIMGPIDELVISEDSEMATDIEKSLGIVDFLPAYSPGEVIVSSPSWCNSKHLFEAVIYKFEDPKITSKEIVTEVLEKCVEMCNEWQLEAVAMDALGTEYGAFSYAEFVEVLQETIFCEAGAVSKLRELTIALETIEHLQKLKGAFASVLGIKIP